MVWARSAAQMPVVTPSRASMASQKAVPKREVLIGDISGRCEVVAALFGERQADQPAAVRGHEVDGFGRDFFGGHGEVAFVFAVLVVDENDHAALADFLDSFFDGGEFRRVSHACPCSLFGSRYSADRMILRLIGFAVDRRRE